MQRTAIIAVASFCATFPPYWRRVKRNLYPDASFPFHNLWKRKLAISAIMQATKLSSQLAATRLPVASYCFVKICSGSDDPYRRVQSIIFVLLASCSMLVWQRTKHGRGRSPNMSCEMRRHT